MRNSAKSSIANLSETLDGLWRQNPALVQLVGLCPLLAVTNTVVNGLTLGLATLAVMIATNVLISSLRHALVPAVRIPLFVLIIATLVTCIDLLTNALFFALHEILGLFIPLIVTNCTILAQAETVASRRNVVVAAASAAASGTGFLLVLVALGALREAFGSGTLFAGFEMLLGPAGSKLEIALPMEGMLVAALPPGAFFGLAILLALRNLQIDRAGRRGRASGDESAQRQTMSGAVDTTATDDSTGDGTLGGLR